MKKYSKRLTCVLLACALLMGLLLTGCGGSGSNDGTKEDASASGKTYQTELVNVSTSVTTLAPFTNGFTSKMLTYSVYEPLMSMDYETTEMVPFIGKKLTNPSEGVYEVEIFDYVTDSNGNHITADDVLYSFEKARESGFFNNIMSTLTAVEKIDDYNIRLVFTNMRKDVYKQVLSNINIISKAAYEASSDGMATDKPCGTGAYVVESFVSAAEAVVVAREDYWQTDDSVRNWISTQNTKRIAFQALADKTANAMSLRSGEIDITYSIADEDQQTFVDFDSMTAKEGYSACFMPNGAHRHITFNCSTNSPCQDVNLRKAICHAIDIDGVIASCDRYIGARYNEYSACPSYTDVPASMLKEAGSYWEYDVDLAKEYLAKSSYNGETIRILVNPAGWMAAGTVIGAYLDAIGIKYELLSYDAALYADQHADESGTLYDIDLSEISNFFAFWNANTTLDINSYSSGVNHLFIKDDHLQELYDAAASADGTPEDIQALADYVDEQCYAYSLFYCTHVFYGSDRITKWARIERQPIPGACEYSR